MPARQDIVDRAGGLGFGWTTPRVAAVGWPSFVRLQSWDDQTQCLCRPDALQ